GKRPEPHGHPGASGEVIELSDRSGWVPQRKRRQRKVAVDVLVVAVAADLVLPGGDVIGASGRVRLPHRGVRLRPAAGDERRLEGPDVRLGGERRDRALRLAPRVGELAAGGAVAVEDRHVTRAVDAVVPPADEPRVDIDGTRTGCAWRLDVDRD